MYTICAIISAVFFLLGLLQAKFTREKTDLKKLIKQTIVVFASSLAGITITQQMNSSSSSTVTSTEAFTNNPDF